MTAQRMPPELKAAIERIFEIAVRVTAIEGSACHTNGLVQELLRRDSENAALLAQLKVTTDHVLRLTRQKEQLLASYGRLSLEARKEFEGPNAAEVMSNFERAMLGRH